MAPIQSGCNRKLSAAANLANLLPTGTVLAFQALLPSLSNNGSCLLAHKCLTLSVIIVFSFVCFLSSFTDSYVSNGKVYYGIAHFKGIYIFNDDHDCDEEKEVGGGDLDQNKENSQASEKKAGNDSVNKEDYRIRSMDFVHAICSLLVFLVFATNDSDVQNCFFPHATPNEYALMINLPLTVSAGISFLFMLFPTTRRGIGYADSVAPKK